MITPFGVRVKYCVALIRVGTRNVLLRPPPVTLVHYQTRGYGTNLHDPALAQTVRALGLEVQEEHGHAIAAPGWAGMVGALGNALFEYVPFIVLLFALYCNSGGIAVSGDIPAHPATNTAILALGGVLAKLRRRLSAC